jgi:hypothetical protein
VVLCWWFGAAGPFVVSTTASLKSWKAPLARAGLFFLSPLSGHDEIGIPSAAFRTAQTPCQDHHGGCSAVLRGEARHVRFEPMQTRRVPSLARPVTGPAALAERHRRVAY